MSETSKSEQLIDPAQPVREGEELDLAALRAYFAENVPELDGELTLAQFPSGHSNLTYLLKVGDTEYVLRRPPFGSKVATAHDMGREFRVMGALQGHYPFVPRMVHHCDDTAVIGAPFYIMERVRGLILRQRPPKGLELTEATMRGLCEVFIDNLVSLHGVDYQAAGLGDMGRPEGYVKRQVEGWTKRYHGSKTDEIAHLEEVTAWLADKQPSESGAGVIHNDYKYDNIVLDADNPHKILAVLDWEMATVGDPCMDLATTLGYWVEAGDSDQLKMIRMCLTDLPGNFTRRELAERYAEKSGRDRMFTHMDFYYVYGLFKLAVIIQQIYYRYKQGLTKDERFANLIVGVHILLQTAHETIEKSKL